MSRNFSVPMLLSPSGSKNLSAWVPAEEDCLADIVDTSSMAPQDELPPSLLSTGECVASGTGECGSGLQHGTLCASHEHETACPRAGKDPVVPRQGRTGSGSGVGAGAGIAAAAVAGSLAGNASAATSSSGVGQAGRALTRRTSWLATRDAVPSIEALQQLGLVGGPHPAGSMSGGTMLKGKRRRSVR